jgi:hydroxymethylbilane synthase
MLYAMSLERECVIGSRGSVLAWKQCEEAAKKLCELYPGLSFHKKVIRTEGDELERAPFPGKGSFVKKLQEALLRGEIDVAVHSLKDMPVSINAETEIAAFLKREDARDVLVSVGGMPLEELPPGATVGTSSPRRALQLKLCRPDLVILPLRGNVDTRLAKVTGGELQAAVLASAGMIRLGFADRITQYLPLDRFLPSAGQGIIALEIRCGDERLRALLARLDHNASRIEGETERLLVKELQVDCSSPAGAHATVHGRTLTLRAMFAPHENGEVVWGEAHCYCEERREMARLLAHGMAEASTRGGKARGYIDIPELRIWKKGGA